MGIIDYYSKLSCDTEIRQPSVPKEPEVTFAGLPILRDAVNVTLAEYDIETKNAITAHRLKDYRRKTFNLVLLPKVTILFDKVIEGSDYWRGLLSNENFNHE